MFGSDELASVAVRLDAQLSGLVSEAEHSIRQFNDEGWPALDPLARFLLRTKSIASSQVEGMQLGVRELARAEARAESGITRSPTALDLLANIDAMVLAVDVAANAKRFRVAEIVAIHRRLLERSQHKTIAGRIRARQNWIGGSDYNPCGADYVPPPTQDVDRLLSDLCARINDDTCRLSSRRRSCMHSSRPSIPLTMGTAARGAPSCMSCCGASGCWR